MKAANRSGLLAIPGLPKPALILLAAAMLLLAGASGVAYSATPDGGSENTIPYFVDPNPIPTQIYRVGQAIPTLQLPRAAGGNGALQYWLRRSTWGEHCGAAERLGSRNYGSAVKHQGSGSGLTNPKATGFSLPNFMNYTPPKDSDNHGGTIGPDDSHLPTKPAKGCMVLFVTDSDAGVLFIPLTSSRRDYGRFYFNVTVLPGEGSDAPVSSIDYDLDDDGLIEIRNLTQLDAVRRDMNGDGKEDPLNGERAGFYNVFRPGYHADGFPNAVSGMGCPDTGCKGYELMADLDFDSNGDGKVTAEDHGGAFWNHGTGWWPLGLRYVNNLGIGHSSFIMRYSAIFEGNGHTIANLFINRTAANYEFVDYLHCTGLFHQVTGIIRNLGVVNAEVTSDSPYGTGILAGMVFWGGQVRNSYTTGQVSLGYEPHPDRHPSQHYSYLGGLVGKLYIGGEIVASYSTASVVGRGDAISGGLVGHMNTRHGYDESRNKRESKITASYATGAVTGADGYSAGGLVGQIEKGKITDSYATGKVTGSPGVSGGLVGKAIDAAIANSYYRDGAAGPMESGVGVGKDTKELQEPTGYTGIYAKWNRDLDGDGNSDAPWDFGTASEYPVLKVDFNGDGKATWEEFGSQRASQGATPNSQSPEEQAAAAHPEVYKEAEYGLEVACSDVQKFHAKLTFDLGGYTGKLALSLSLWGSSSYLSYESHGLKTPALHRNGQTASVEISTHPPKTRFRLDTPDGRNLLLGYADCRTDAPALDEDGNPPPPPPKTPEERAAEDNKEVYEADNGNGDDAPMSVSCEVGDDSATLTFNLGSHSGAVQLTLMQWDGVVFRSYAALGLTAPALQRNGQTATVEIPTHTPERVRFRLDSQYGRNLLLGYADCHEDTPGPVTEVTEEAPEETVTPVTPGGSGPVVQSAAATLPASATAANREVYADAGRAMAVSCTGVTSKSATLTFDLGSYTRSLTMVLSLWDGTVFRSYASQNIAQPALEREGQKATVSIATNPALTRFRLDSDIGTNLLLGYADCRTDPS